MPLLGSMFSGSRTKRNGLVPEGALKAWGVGWCGSGADVKTEDRDKSAPWAVGHRRERRPFGREEETEFQEIKTFFFFTISLGATGSARNYTPSPNFPLEIVQGKKEEK